MKLTFLGTSAGKPTKERNVSALALEFDQQRGWYLFDCGEGTQRQITCSRLSLEKLDAIFITHLHGDHYYGLPGLLASKTLDSSVTPLSIFAPKGLRKFLESALNISEEHLGYNLTIIEYMPQEEFVFDKFTMKVLPLVHSKESAAFYIQENDISNRLDEEKLRHAGFEPSPLYGEIKRGKSLLIDGKKVDAKEFMLDVVPGRSIIIAGDNSRPDVLGSYLEDLDLLVHECTYTQDVYDKLERKLLHTTARDLGIAVKNGGVKNLIANHINPRYNKDNTLGTQLLYDEIRSAFDGGLFIADDFDSYYLNRDGSVSVVS